MELETEKIKDKSKSLGKAKALDVFQRKRKSGVL